MVTECVPVSGPRFPCCSGPRERGSSRRSLRWAGTTAWLAACEKDSSGCREALPSVLYLAALFALHRSLPRLSLFGLSSLENPRESQRGVWHVGQSTDHFAVATLLSQVHLWCRRAEQAPRRSESFVHIHTRCKARVAQFWTDGLVNGEWWCR